MTEVPSQTKPVATAVFENIYILLCTWFVGGMYIDGWAHSHVPQLETFFTPWHGILYSGYLISALFLLFNWILNIRKGHAWRNALPSGYGASLIGAAIFVVAGLLDMLWHLTFGIERNIEALLSPTHLLLATGAFLMFSGPLRSGLVTIGQGIRIPFPKFFPIVLSCTYVVALLIFFTEYAHPIVHSFADLHTNQSLEAFGIISIFWQTALYMGMVLFMARAWKVPFGSYTIFFAILTGLASLFAGRTSIPLCFLLGALIGAAVDVFYLLVQPDTAALLRYRVFAFVVPVLYTFFYFAALAITKGGLAWTLDLWLGAVVLSGVVGLLLSYLMIPPAIITTTQS